MTGVKIGKEPSEVRLGSSESSGLCSGLRFEGASLDNERRSALKGSSLRSFYRWANVSIRIER